MITADLVIRSGLVVSPDSVIEASVAIKDGRVIAVGDDTIMPRAAETLDARGLHVLPGAIDDHVHFRDPGYSHKEDFASGTAAAAFGGVTTVFDMPNTIPPTGTPQILADKLKMATGKAHVDFGLYALLGEDTIEHVPELAKSAIGFKLYMGNTFGKMNVNIADMTISRKGDKALMLLKVDSEPSKEALAALRADPALEVVKAVTLPAAPTSM